MLSFARGIQNQDLSLMTIPQGVPCGNGETLEVVWKLGRELGDRYPGRLLKFRGRNFCKLGRVVTPQNLIFGVGPHFFVHDLIFLAHS